MAFLENGLNHGSHEKKSSFAASGSRGSDLLSQPVTSSRVHKRSGVVSKYRKLPGAPSLPAPKKNSWQEQRVMKDLEEHDAQINTNAITEKWICECPEHEEDPRYNVFKHTGPIAIPRCAFKCPFCPYNPTFWGDELQKGVASTLRKHIKNMHCGKFQYWGLYVVSQEDSVSWFYQEIAAAESEEEIDEEEEILRDMEVLMQRLRDIRRRR